MSNSAQLIAAMSSVPEAIATKIKARLIYAIGV
jgi:hypothetical protein